MYSRRRRATLLGITVPLNARGRNQALVGLGSYIVNAQGGWSDTLADGVLVEINLGHDEQLQPGDFLTVWRESPQPGQPPQVLGEIGVLTTEAHTATGKILATRYAMRVGDHVEIR